MKIRQVHAHFLISIGNYSNERIGFSVELNEEETPEEVIPRLREQAKSIVGQPASELYNEKYKLESAIRSLRTKLESLRAEWEATSQFLRAQGLNPNAPAMPIFNNLLPGVEEETVTHGEIVDELF